MNVGGYQYKENAQEIFENFFGTSNPFASFGFGDSAPFANKLTKPGPKKQEPFMQDLTCSLSELFNGCVKTFEVSRKRFDSGGQLVDESKCLTVNVKQGWKKGTKVTFPGEGDEGPDVLAADIVFVIQETNEMCYTREGNNLIYTHKISLSDALSDCSLQIPTLDRRLISLACPEVVSPYYEKLIPGTSH
jgi:DnaJ-class molecular chaperone